MIEDLKINKEEITENTDFIIVDNIEQTHTILNNNHISNAINNTVLGTLSIFYNEKNGYGVYLNNNECIIISDSENNKNVDIRIAAINKEPYEVKKCKDIIY